MDDFEYETNDQYENDLDDYEYQQESYDIDLEEIIMNIPDELS
jgi:hypothetical protein